MRDDIRRIIEIVEPIQEQLAKLDELRAVKDQRMKRLTALEAIRDDEKLREFISRVAYGDANLSELIETTRLEVDTLIEELKRQTAIGIELARKGDRE